MSTKEATISGITLHIVEDEHCRVSFTIWTEAGQLACMEDLPISKACREMGAALYEALGNSGKPGVRHEKTKALNIASNYHHRSGAKTGQWKNTFECPLCHRITKQLHNFLAGKVMWCDGIKWSKQAEAVR